MDAKQLSSLTKYLRELCGRDAVVRLRQALEPHYYLYLVGGAIRQTLEGTEVHDLDFATLLTVEEVERRCSRAGIRTIPTGQAHGTLTTLIDDETFEITSLRPHP